MGSRMTGLVPHGVLDLLGEGVIVARGDAVMSANAAAIEMFGDDLNGKQLLDLVPQPVPGARLHPDGSDFTFEVIAIEPTDTATTVVVRDVTKLVDLERHVSRRAETDRLLASLSTRLFLAPANRLEGAIEGVFGDIAAAVGADRIAVIRHNEGGTLTAVHEWTAVGIEGRAAADFEVPLDDFTWSTSVMLRHEWLCVEDVDTIGSEAQAEQQYFQRNGVRSFVQVPMVVGGAVIGRLSVESTRRSISWDDETADAVRQLVGMLGSVLIQSEAVIVAQGAREQVDRVDWSNYESISRLSCELRISLDSALGFAEIMRSDAKRSAADVDALERISRLLNDMDGQLSEAFDDELARSSPSSPDPIVSAISPAQRVAGPDVRLLQVENQRVERPPRRADRRRDRRHECPDGDECC